MVFEAFLFTMIINDDDALPQDYDDDPDQIHDFLMQSPPPNSLLTDYKLSWHNADIHVDKVWTKS